MQSLNFNKRFNGLLGTMLSTNLVDKLPNENMLKLLSFLFVILVLLLKSLDRNKIVLFNQKIGALGFDNYKKWFLPNILLSILLSILFFRLSS